ncbi:Lrp/AsnC family transcriptional regulator [Streptomyces sp. NBC_00012]|uniref:Lrp/AsnC family transcriptional regulator n=1 Tax=Streptomyces sp. NBC_00012 TaxID=2975621 RepID=UPI00386D475D
MTTGTAGSSRWWACSAMSAVGRCTAPGTCGYAAVVDPERLGLPILALVRLRYPNGHYKPFHDLLDTTPEIVEAHHVTGDDCFVLKVTARSMSHLEEVAGRIGALGSVTTSVVYSSPLPRRAIGRSHGSGCNGV